MSVGGGAFATCQRQNYLFRCPSPIPPDDADVSGCEAPLIFFSAGDETRRDPSRSNRSGLAAAPWEMSLCHLEALVEEEETRL